MSTAKFLPTAVLGAVLAAQIPAASAEDVDADYFKGHWTINSACDDAESEYIHIRGNGTLEYGRRGKAEAVGFWASEKSVLDMELLAAPASFQDIESALATHTVRGIYTMQVMPVEHKKDTFRGVAGIGNQMAISTWTRCK